MKNDVISKSNKVMDLLEQAIEVGQTIDIDEFDLDYALDKIEDAKCLFEGAIDDILSTFN